MNNITNSNFMKICIHNLEINFLEKYSNLLSLNEKYKKFYTKGGRGSNQQAEIYNHFHKSRFNIALDNYFQEKYFILMHTYYIKELQPKGISNYSVNFFFYDMWNIIKENLKNLENIQEFQDKK